MLLSALVIAASFQASLTDVGVAVLQDAEAALLVSDDRVSVLANLGRAWAPRDPRKASALLETAWAEMRPSGGYPKPHDEIISAWCEFDLKRAEMVLDSLQPEDREQAEKEFIGALAKANPEKAAARLEKVDSYMKDLLAEDTAKDVATTNLPYALRFAKALSEENRPGAIRGAALGAARKNLTTAVKMIGELDDPEDREWGYRYLISDLLESGSPNALKVLPYLKTIEHRLDALCRIAEQLMPSDPNLAKKMADESIAVALACDPAGDDVESLQYRSLAILARLRPETTRPLLEKIELLGGDNRQWMSLVGAWSYIDVDHAKLLFQNHLQERYMNTCFGAYMQHGYVDLIVAMVKKSPAEALALIRENNDFDLLARSVRDPDFRARVDFAAWETFIEKSEEDRLRGIIHLDLLGQRAMRNPSKAGPILAQLFADLAPERFEIARGVANQLVGKPTEALATLAYITSPLNRAAALIELAAKVYPSNPEASLAIFLEARKQIERVDPEDQAGALADLGLSVSRVARAEWART